MIKASNILVQNSKPPIPVEATTVKNSSELRTYVFSFCLATVALIFATYYAYRPVLFNFFSGDDYGFLAWLKLAMSQPELISRYFHHVWMDGDGRTPLFYRPLITAIMALEYSIWGPNGLLFRITNLVFLGLGGLFVGLITFELANLSTKLKDSKVENLVFAFVAAALFTLYPLHQEAIVWIIGRMDGLCTVFMLGSLWFYIRWREFANAYLLLLSLTCGILAFTCKEMAIALPSIVVVCELVFGDLFCTRSNFTPLLFASNKATKNIEPNDADSELKSLTTWFSVKAINRTAIHTAPFILLLGFYFLMRRIFLGTFVGGYDNSLSLNFDFIAYFSRFVDGLTKVIVPAHWDLYERHYNFVQYWEFGVAACVILSAIAFITRPSTRRLTAFSVVWFVLALIPVYKVFMISLFLQGSRAAYLATAPLSMFLARGMVPTSYKNISQRVLVLLPISMLFLSTYILHANNLVWREAGNITNRIQQQIGLLYKQIPGDPQVIITGLPMHYKGAYICWNAIGGMTKFPQIERDVSNCSSLTDQSPGIPFGFLKTSILENRDRIKCFYWDSSTRTIKPVNLPEKNDLLCDWRGAALKQIISPNPSDNIKITQEPSGGLRIRAPRSARYGIGIPIDLHGLPCSSTDFISIKLRLYNLTSTLSKTGLCLQYTNDISNSFSMSNYTRTSVESTNKEQEVIFPLRHLPEWSFGGTCHGVQLLLPEKSDLVIEEISVKPPDKTIPTLSFAHSQYLESRGTLQLNAQTPKQVLTYDVSHLPGTAGVTLELTQLNASFEHPYCKEPSTGLMKSTALTGTHGHFELCTNDFPGNGAYQLRLRATDTNGKPVGLAGDHIDVLVAGK